jgi:hypothetical protein
MVSAHVIISTILGYDSLWTDILMGAYVVTSIFLITNYLLARIKRKRTAAARSVAAILKGENELVTIYSTNDGLVIKEDTRGRMRYFKDGIEIGPVGPVELFKPRQSFLKKLNL